MKPIREIWKYYTSGLKMKEGAPSQGTLVAFRCWERQETILPRASKKEAALLTP